MSRPVDGAPIIPSCPCPTAANRPGWRATGPIAATLSGSDGRNPIHSRRLDWVDRYYAPDAIVHAGGGRYAQGPRDIQTLFIHLLSAIPDGVLRVEHVCHSEERDGVIVAVRWTLEGRTAPGGVLGECPVGSPVRMMGISHLRLAGARIVEEWMLFDEVGVLVQAYRA